MAVISGRVRSAIDPRLGRSTQAFDADGNRTVLVDPNNNQTSLSFDKAGRLTGITPAIGGGTDYVYNSRNLLSQVTNGRDQVTDLQYDDAGRLSGFTDPVGTVSYSYDPNGNLLTAGDGAGAVSREYDKLNRITKYTDSQGNIIEYGYDQVGNLTSLIYPGGKQVSYEYDNANRLITVTDWAYRVTAYEYDANDRLVKTIRPNGTVLNQSYDSAGRLTQQKDIDQIGSIISQYDFTYDKAGNVATETNAIGEQPFTLSSPEMTYSQGNRLAAFDGQNTVYDADGNMTTGPLQGNMATYSYDARNRLTAAGNLNYLYDAENNRIGVNETVYGQVYTTLYVVNPNSYLSQVLIKTDNDGNKTYYVYGLGLVGQEDPDGTYHTYSPD